MKLLKCDKLLLCFGMVFLLGQTNALVNLKQELPISIGNTKAQVFEKLGQPSATDYEWIYNDSNSNRNYYVEFHQNIVSQIKVINWFERHKDQKLVNGLTFQDSFRNWIKVFGEPVEVIPSGSETTMFWKISEVWIALTIDSNLKKNTWFCIEKSRPKQK